MMPNTASTFARRIAARRNRRGGDQVGRVLARDRSQARPPASWPAAMTSTGTSKSNAPPPLEKLRHSRTAGGSR